MSNEEKNIAKWRLQKIEIEYQTYGPNSGKYLGKIKFANTDWETFTFNLSEEMANAYLKMIAQGVVSNAEELSKSLIETLGVTLPCDLSS